MNEDEIVRRNASEYDIHAQSWQSLMSSNMGHKYLEKPAMERELPSSLEGKNVLCIGVGSGEELQEILKRNPAHVVGIDISNNLLNLSRSRFPNVELCNMDMNVMSFPDETFDFVYSSLTLHYAKDWDVLCSEICRVLKRGGELLFSTHHPDYWSKHTPTGNSYTNARGVTLSEHTALLLGEITIIYYNHPNINSICDAIEHAGFKIEKKFAPSVVEIAGGSLPQNDMDRYQNLKAKNKESPLFFIIKAIKQ